VCLNNGQKDISTTLVNTGVTRTSGAIKVEAMKEYTLVSLYCNLQHSRQIRITLKQDDFHDECPIFNGSFGWNPEILLRNWKELISKFLFDSQTILTIVAPNA
jgi:hypothetical protein